MKTNKDIRIKAIERGVYHWQIAEKLDIAPESFSRMMRRELDAETKERVMQAIEAAANAAERSPVDTGGGQT